jgi:hypothetical protein
VTTPSVYPLTISSAPILPTPCKHSLCPQLICYRLLQLTSTIAHSTCHRLPTSLDTPPFSRCVPSSLLPHAGLAAKTGRSIVSTFRDMALAPLTRLLRHPHFLPRSAKHSQHINCTLALQNSSHKGELACHWLLVSELAPMPSHAESVASPLHCISRREVCGGRRENGHTIMSLPHYCPALSYPSPGFLRISYRKPPWYLKPDLADMQEP